MHNASKATCKTPEKEIRAIPSLSQSKSTDPSDGLPPGVPPDEGARNAAMYNTPYPPPYIYDPVMKAADDANLEEHHH